MKLDEVNRPESSDVNNKLQNAVDQNIPKGAIDITPDVKENTTETEPVADINAKAEEAAREAKEKALKDAEKEIKAAEKARKDAEKAKKDAERAKKAAEQAMKEAEEKARLEAEEQAKLKHDFVRLGISIPSNVYDDIKFMCQKLGDGNVSGYVTKLILQDMEKNKEKIDNVKKLLESLS